MGLTRLEGARILRISEGTVRSYLTAYVSGSLDAMRVLNPHPKTAALNAHAVTLREVFEAAPPHTVQDAVDRIEALTGVRRRTGQIPGKGDLIAQPLFLETQLNPILAEAQADRRHVFFVDAAHFV